MYSFHHIVFLVQICQQISWNLLDHLWICHTVLQSVPGVHFHPVTKREHDWQVVCEFWGCSVEVLYGKMVCKWATRSAATDQFCIVCTVAFNSLWWGFYLVVVVLFSHPETLNSLLWKINVKRVKMALMIAFQPSACAVSHGSWDQRVLWTHNATLNRKISLLLFF